MSLGVIKANPNIQTRYIVWSMHTFLASLDDSEYGEDAIFGEIATASGLGLGRVYFKLRQWACSYGMKAVTVTDDLAMLLEFESAADTDFYITDYQIVVFDSLDHANAYVNSREFSVVGNINT